MDLLLALIVQFTVAHRLNLVRILQSIAAGLLGPSARESGYPAAGLGLIFHFLIATIWAGIYFGVVRCLAWLPRLSLATVMIFVGHTLFVGLPIALAIGPVPPVRETA